MINYFDISKTIGFNHDIDICNQHLLGVSLLCNWNISYLHRHLTAISKYSNLLAAFLVLIQ